MLKSLFIIALLVLHPFTDRVKAAVRINAHSVHLETGVYDLTSEEIRFIHKKNTVLATRSLTQGTQQIPANAAHFSDVQFLNQTQKTTIAVIAGAIAFLFLFLTLFFANFINDVEYSGSSISKSLSPVKLSSVCALFLVVFGCLSSHWIHGSYPEFSPGLPIFLTTALLTAAFHHLLRVDRNSTANKNLPKIQKRLGYLLSSLNVLIVLYFLFPLVSKARFSEVPAWLIITQIIVSLIHIGVRAHGSSISSSPLLKHLFKTGITRKAHA